MGLKTIILYMRFLLVLISIFHRHNHRSSLAVAPCHGGNKYARHACTKIGGSATKLCLAFSFRLWHVARLTKEYEVSPQSLQLNGRDLLGLSKVPHN
jgi:hypothetical protein